MYEERKKRLEKRIDAMHRYAENEYVCRSNLLLEYFGETGTKPCGICDVCLEKNKKDITVARFAQIEQAIYDALKEKTLSVNQLVERLPYPSTEALKIIRFLIDEGKLETEKGMVALKFS